MLSLLLTLIDAWYYAFNDSHLTKQPEGLFIATILEIIFEFVVLILTMEP